MLSVHNKYFSIECKMRKINAENQLINFMHCCGFDWICAVAYINDQEMVASKMNDSDNFWWRSLETEGSGFTQLFKGSIRSLYER